MLQDLGRSLKGLMTRSRGHAETRSDIGERMRAVVEQPFFAEQMQLADLAQRLLERQSDPVQIREEVVLVLLAVIRKSWANLELAEAANALVTRECERFGLGEQDIRDVYGAILIVAERPTSRL